MTSRLLSLAAWGLLVAVALVTVVPIGLRPVVTSPHIERFVSFGIVGLAFSLAYPRHLTRIMLLVVAVAVGLELLQLLVVTRHARPQDVAVKLVGAGAGIAAGAALNRLRQRAPRAG